MSAGQRFARYFRFLSITAGLGVLSLAVFGSASAATTEVFQTTSPIDLGTNLDKLADLDPWSYTLGTDWDENFTIGGIIGAPNTTIIPEVKVLDAVVIPEVKADTRTGARMKGRVFGDVGLEFSADYVASGLEPGVGFHFEPTLSYPTAPEAGSFIQLSTTTGVQDNPAFTEAALELPSVSAEVDFFFNLGLNSTIDYGLFPIVPYNSAPFINASINLDQRNDPDKSLVKFAASFDPDTNGGSPLPPTLTFLDGVELFGLPLESQVGLLDDGQFLANKQISFEIKDKQNPNGPKRRIDVGEVQVLNPFGTGGDLLGGNTDRNLKIGTTIEDEAIGYTAETPLFRLGLDLDGIAAALATGQSFTRIEEELKIDDAKIAEITADLIDLKYGPEIGFRESVEINPDFNVTVNFFDPSNGAPVDVALDDEGSVSLMSTFEGQWGDLPEIALLTADAVEVAISFDELTGEQSKRGAFYLTDYLEFTLLELESLNILDLLDISVPPVFRTRTSLLGNLLGELELEAYTDSQAITPFDLGGALPTTSFTITPTPTMLAYLTAGGNFNPDFGSVRRLADHTLAGGSALAGLTVVIGRGDTSSASVGDLTPLSVTDAGHRIDAETLMFQQGLLGEGFPVDNETYSDPRQKTPVMGLQLVDGSTYTQSGSRTWETATIRNDGVYTSSGEMTRFSNPGGTILLTGSGLIEFEQRGRLDATVIVHAQGHTIRFDTATGFGLQTGPFTTIQVDPDGSSPPLPLSIRLPDQVVDAPRFIDAANVFINAGTLNLVGSIGEIYAGMEFDNSTSGRIDSVGDGNPAADEVIALTTPDFTNNGAVTVGPGAQLDFRHPDSNLAQGLRGDGSIRVDGGAIRFLTNVTAYAPDNAAIPDAATQTFQVVNGGSLEFLGNTVFYAKPTFEVGADSTLTFNGLGLDGTSGLFSRFGPGAPIDVVNDGTLVFNSGSNSFKLAINEILSPGEEPTVIPIGLDNRGVVEIRNTARLTLDAEIRDYTNGGAVFDTGTWKIIGPTPTGLYNNLTSDDSNVARFNLNVDRVEFGDNYLSVISPGAGDGFPDGFTDTYDPTAYDTFLAINRSDITLSGRAKFAYLNTVQRNEGALTFDNKQHFTTAGGLVNTGQIDVTRGSVLEVAGRLLVQGPGSLAHLGAGAGLSLAGEDVPIGDGTTTQLQHVVVDGGALVFDTDADNTTSLFTQRNDGLLLTGGKTWIVRDSTAENADGSTTTAAGNIFLNIAVGTPGVVRNDATVILEGNQAFFNGLESTLQYQHGSLTLRGGKVYQSQQNYFRNAPGAETILEAAQLIVPGEFRQEGFLSVDADSYLRADFFNALGGTIVLDGVIEADALSVPAATTLSGSGRLSGDLLNAGRIEPGNSPGALRSFGAFTQSESGTTVIEITGPGPGSGHDLLVAEALNLAGTLELATDPDFDPDFGEAFAILLGAVAGTFDRVDNNGLIPGKRLAVRYGPGFVLAQVALAGDANLDGTVTASGDGSILLSNLGSASVWEGGDFDGSGAVTASDDGALLLAGLGTDAAAAVPEPGALRLVSVAALCAAWGACGRRWRA